MIVPAARRLPFLAVLLFGALTSCGPSSRRDAESIVPTTRDGSAMPADVSHLLRSNPSLFVPRETSKGWLCDVWTYAPAQGENLGRLVSSEHAFAGECNAKGASLSRVEWELELDGTVLGATPLYHFQDGEVLTSSHARFLAILSLGNETVQVAQFETPDHAARRSGAYAVGHWYLSAAACKRATRLDSPPILAVSAQTLTAPVYSCAAR